MIATRTKPFLSLTAEDLMSRDLVLIPSHVSLRTAARMLSSARVSGAPIVDENGQCVGVISATDFVRWIEGEPRKPPIPCGPACVCSEWQVVDYDYLPEDEVGHYATHDMVTVGPWTTLGEIARKMLDAHIHRVIVVDQTMRPVGVVSSTDVLAAVAYAEGRMGAVT
jgi:CBS domain-containing protein